MKDLDEPEDMDLKDEHNNIDLADDGNGVNEPLLIPIQETI